MADKSKAQVYNTDCSGSVAGTVMFLAGENLKGHYEWDEPEETGMIGTDKPANTGRQVKKIDVTGDVLVRPSYAQANVILQTWFDETTGTFTPANDPNASTGAIVIDRLTDIYTYAACWLAELELAWNENEPVDWKLSLLGTTEVNAGTVAALVVPDRMMTADLTLTIGGDTYFPASGRFRFGYNYDPPGGRFHQSQTRSSVSAKIPFALVELDFDMNADTWADILALAGTDTAIDDVLLTFADGTNTLVIDMAETVNVTPERVPDGAGDENKMHTAILKAKLDSLETEMFEARYS